MNKKTKFFIKLIFGLFCIIIGVLLNIFVGFNSTLPFNGVGNFLIYGGVLTVISTIIFFKKQRLIDERIELIAYKTLKIVYAIIIYSLFIIMIIDMIIPIKMSYYLFISYLIMSYMLIYFIVYYFIERRN